MAEQPAAVVTTGRLWGGMLDVELAQQLEPLAAWVLAWLPGLHLAL